MRINRLSVEFFTTVDVFNPKLYSIRVFEDGWSLVFGPLWVRWWPERKVK